MSHLGGENPLPCHQGVAYIIVPRPRPQIDKVYPFSRPSLIRLIQQCLMTVVEKFWPKIDSNGIANNRIELFIGMNSFAGWEGFCRKVVKFYSYLGWLEFGNISVR